MHRAAQPKFTCAKVEGLRSKRRAFEVTVALEKLDGCARSRIVLDAAQGDVRVESPHIDGKSCCEQGVVDLLAQLIESRMAVADSNPDYPGGSTRRKGTDAAQRKQKRFDPDALERRRDGIKALDIDVAEKPERQM